MSKWQFMGTPGYLGKHRDEKFAEWTKEFGEQGIGWRLAWIFGEALVDFLGACAVYEDAYFEFFRKNPEILRELILEASDVYDDAESNVASVIDYRLQETDRTHVQDIAIRRCVLRSGLRFKGAKLIRIRQEKGTHPLSILLSPGRVPFHRPELITSPEIEGWWYDHTVEAFYQSNRILQVCKE